MTEPWPAPFVGAHILLTEPKPAKLDEEAMKYERHRSRDTWPKQWDDIRFDAIDVLFISPFGVMKDCSFNLMEIDNGNLLKRFETVVRAARTKNRKIKIIVEQFYGEPSQDYDFEILQGERIETYATSVAAFLESYHNKYLESFPPGSESISARINGWDVDVEGSTRVENLTEILSGIRTGLDELAGTLDAPKKFSVSITPAWIDGLNNQTAKVIDYLNMQNYSGGDRTFPADYQKAAPGLLDRQIVWGLCSEEPYRSNKASEAEPDCTKFEGVKQTVMDIRDRRTSVYAWRVNSDNYVFENDFQIWLYNSVHGSTLENSKAETYIAANWEHFGGRTTPP